ncbi:hypothetical protein [Roseibium suaedae]|uniref:hypothetical protein n=1 Tax=Roseibium suaedae TaxID=735517 RepID=UPI001588138D|nr:hypothetical protein [Roseibium suaedae]
MSEKIEEALVASDRAQPYFKELEVYFYNSTDEISKEVILSLKSEFSFELMGQNSRDSLDYFKFGDVWVINEPLSVVEHNPLFQLFYMMNKDSNVVELGQAIERIDNLSIYHSNKMYEFVCSALLNESPKENRRPLKMLVYSNGNFSNGDVQKCLITLVSIYAKVSSE